MPQGSAKGRAVTMNSPIQKLLPLLDGVKQSGSSRWVARCPAHNDSHPSLSIRELDDGRVLLHCFGGCATSEVLAVVGLEIGNLFPPKAIDHLCPSERFAFSPLEALKALRDDAIVVCAAARMLSRNEPLLASDIERLLASAERIADGLSATIGRQSRVPR